MLHSDIEHFLDTLLYPVLDLSIIFNDCIQNFFDVLPQDFIQSQHTKSISNKRKIIYQKALNYTETKCTLNTFDQVHQYMERWYLGQNAQKEFKRQNDGQYAKPETGSSCIATYDAVIYRIRQLSQSMISKFDGHFTYKYWETQGDIQFLGGFSGDNKIHLFRGLNQIIPMDILVACFVLDSEEAERAIHSFSGDVYVTDALLEEVLKKGVAEDHIHMGASAGFPIIWEELMTTNSYFSPAAIEQSVPLKSFDPDKSKENYFCWGYARYLRMWLIIYTTFKQPSCSDPQQLQDLLSSSRGSFLSPAKVFQNGFWESVYANCKTYEDIIELFAETDFGLVNFIKDRQMADALSNQETNYSEGLFLFRVLKTLRSEVSTDPETILFKKLFLHYLCAKHNIFRTMVQHKRVEGLDYFQGYYGSLSKASKSSNRFASQASADSVTKFERLIWAQLSNRNIRKVEFRTSFEDKISNAQKMVSFFLKAYRNILHKHYCQCINGIYHPICELPRIGLVFHFIKSFQEMPDLCAKSSDSSMRQYEELQKQYAKQLDIFLELRNPEKYPGIDHYLVGIDVASLENAVPTWVFCPVYEKARDGKSEPFLVREQIPYQSLGFTCHAGEDFRHLMSGLRRIYEVVRYLKFHAGDRIGHGIALGVDVETWCSEHPNVILPRIEALENYLWAYRMLSTYPSLPSSGDLLYLERRIQQLSSEIFCSSPDLHGTGIPTTVLLQSYEDLFRNTSNCKGCDSLCTETLDLSCNLINPTSFTSNDILKAYNCYHFSSRMNEVIHYHLSPQEITILKILQGMMQEFVSKAGVIVEVNPSSNIIIGGIDTVEQHPMYAMTNYYCDYKDLMICVNSDDPGVFQTNVCNELGIAYMGMIERGIGREACLNWIDRLRENGMRSSFIRSRESNEELLRELDLLISRLE